MSAPSRGDRDHEPPAERELRQQAWRRRGRRGVDRDRVEGRPLRQALAAVADDDLDVARSRARSSSSRAATASRSSRSIVTTSRGEPGEHRRRVARAGADLEHPLGALERQRLADRGDDPGLRDRLAVADRERRVVVGAAAMALAARIALAASAAIAASTRSSLIPRRRSWRSTIRARWSAKSPAARSAAHQKM